MRVAGLRCEQRRADDTLGIATQRPHLSWLTETDARDWRQVAYAIEVTDVDSGHEVWSSGRVESDESSLVAWQGPDLASRQRCRWRVQVTGSDAERAWSEWASFELGLLDPSDWSAEFVVPDAIEPADAAQPVAYLRSEFELGGDVTRATLHVTALGVYEVECNGHRIGDHVLAPGWTSYPHRVRFETFDVTDQLRRGRNAVGVVLADGWYGERYGFEGNRRRIYGEELAARLQLEVVDASGAIHRFGTDESWKSATGPIVASGIYAGENYDARREHGGWSEVAFDDSDWSGVHVYSGTHGALVGRLGPPVRRIAEIAPVAIRRSPSGRTIVDFGQNLVGRVRLRLRSEAGTTITLRHAEILEGGELCTRVLRDAAATDRYTSHGDGVEEWEPRFTFHGFRYVEVDGWPGELRPNDLRAIVCHSDFERTGWFECSDERINRLHENIVWGIRGNFLDLPTDCPQRDERLGWTGDINVFAPTACFLYDVDGFLASWLSDLAAEQGDDGAVPFVVPNMMEGAIATAVWGDAAVVVPWTLYERFGDRGVVATQYPSMRAWIECVIRLAGRARFWSDGFQFGDWVDPAAPPDRPGDARTDRYLVAQASFCHSLEVMTRAAALLALPADERRYQRIGEEARRAFRREYVTPNGRLASDAQTAYALALQWDLLPEGKAREHAADRLAHLVFAEGLRIGTGFVGTPVLCDALCNAGHAEVAYALLEQTDCPSWLYPVLLGATTIWERWDGLRPDGSVNPGEMNSFNHYALGAVGDWLHRTVAGLAPAEPGYFRLAVRIRPGGSLRSARARHLTPYGLATCAWRIEGDSLQAEVVVPPNTTATVHVLDRDPYVVGSGTHTWSARVEK